MSKHTPGSWLVADGNFIVHDCLNNDPSTGQIVAEVPCQGGNPADLSLIAAAPDLLKALKNYVVLGGNVGITTVQAYAAIAKAEGQQ